MYLVLGKGLTQGLEDITITGEASHSNNFTERTNKFYLSLDYNGSNIFLYVNGVNQFQTKTFWNKTIFIVLANISKDFSADNMKQKEWIESVTSFYCIVNKLLLHC